MRREVETIRGLSELKLIQDSRHAGIFRPPESWKDAEFALPLRRFTVDAPITFNGGPSVFYGQPVEITIKPSVDLAITRFGRKGELTAVTPENFSLGKNNIRIGGISVCEHAAALGPGLNFCADYELSGASSFPNFPDGLRTILNRIKPHLVDVGPVQNVTVRAPFLIRFPNGGYVLVQPDEGEGKLIIDHQYDHPKNALGKQKQRIVMEITPESFAFIADARTPSYGLKSALARFVLGIRGVTSLSAGIGQFRFGLGMDAHNAVYISRDKILNGNPKFDAEGGNFEAMAHEIVDKISVLAGIQGRFVGRLTFFRTSHRHDVQALKIIADNLEYGRVVIPDDREGRASARPYEKSGAQIVG